MFRVLRPGTQIGAYKIVSMPVRGGMGVVYFGIDEQQNRPVALKTFRPEYMGDRETRDRFLREGTVWIKLGAHPHTVRCYEVLYQDLIPFLALEFITKEKSLPDASLRSWLIPGHPLPIEQSLLFALQIVRGLKHATNTIPDFVHRDLKPENILVGVDKLPGTLVNRLRVTDFGLARILEGIGEPMLQATQGENALPWQASCRRTQLTHGMMGTPPYMAPEQWNASQIGTFTDVYAFGCILFEMLSGIGAVDGRSVEELGMKHCLGKLNPLPDALPDHIHELLGRCLALEPENRYATWDELETTLASAYFIISGRPVPAVFDERQLDRAERVQKGWSLASIGLSYIDIGKPKVSLQFFDQASLVGKQDNDPELYSAVLRFRSNAYMMMSKLHLAAECCEQAIKISRYIDDRNGEARALRTLGEVNRSLGNTEKFFEYVEHSLALAREIKDYHSEMQSIFNLAVGYHDLRNYKQASEYFEQYLAYVNRNGDLDGEGRVLCNLGGVLAKLGNFAKAIKYYQHSLSLNRVIGNRDGERRALYNLGYIHRESGENQEALKYFEQAALIAQELGSQIAEAEALINVGTILRELGNRPKAMENLENALEIARELENQVILGEALTEIATMNRYSRNLQAALDGFAQVLSLAREIGNRILESDALTGLGNVYLDMGKPHQAIECYRNGLQIARDFNDLVWIASLEANLGKSLGLSGQIEEAVVLLNQAIGNFERIGYASRAQTARKMLAELSHISTSGFMYYAE